MRFIALIVAFASVCLAPLAQAGRVTLQDGPQQIVAVKGYVVTGPEATRDEPAASIMPNTFVIPRNTCQQDKPLQTLRFKPR